MAEEPTPKEIADTELLISMEIEKKVLRAFVGALHEVLYKPSSEDPELGALRAELLDLLSQAAKRDWLTHGQITARRSLQAQLVQHAMQSNEQRYQGYLQAAHTQKQAEAQAEDYRTLHTSGVPERSVPWYRKLGF